MIAFASASTAPTAPTSPRYVSLVETAKAIRAALKTAFPRCKFSVRGHSYAGGASINVSWTDGPTIARVDAITGAFQGKTFDGADDSSTYVTAIANGERVRYASDYVHTSRSLSLAAIVRASDAVVAAFGLSGLAVPTVRETAHGAELVDNAAARFIPTTSDWRGYSVAEWVRIVANDRTALDAVRADRSAE